MLTPEEVRERVVAGLDGDGFAEQLAEDYLHALRILAVERGEESQAPEGWRQHATRTGWWCRTVDFLIKVFEWDGVYTWEVWSPSTASLVCHGHAHYALEAMEAADKEANSQP